MDVSYELRRMSLIWILNRRIENHPDPKRLVHIRTALLNEVSEKPTLAFISGCKLTGHTELLEESHEAK